eukprot:TRINITY_DN1687_c1_g2_i1.p1 TRINITY_DN1687_c1_g2~~TRINITY_DN1687_c1_g2_i1.p1  ORF type:complete len:1926 (+),score=475.61 TRINITY_DN1687_c1_g2_i1:14559-20336(+)
MPFNASKSYSLAVIVFACFALMCASCGGDDTAGSKQQSGSAPAKQAPPEVKAVKVQTANVPITAEYVAETQAKEKVEIRARVAGFLKERHYVEGSIVEEGDLLFTIDPSQYEQTLNEAKAELERNRASLEKARKDQERFKELVDQGAVSQSEYDTRETEAKELEATVESNKAAVKQAEINLGYTKVYAPTKGRISKAKVQVGSLVGQGENTLLAEITSIDPMYVNFSISEQEYLQFVKQRRDGESPPPNFQLVLSNSDVYPHNGTIDYVDPTIDKQTGTLGVRTVFPNPNGVLRPGLFGRVRVTVTRDDESLLVPQRAVYDVQGIKQVYVAQDNGTLVSKTVRLGNQVGQFFRVESGVEPGEVVLVEGLQKFRPGMTVDPRIVSLQDGTDKAAAQDNATTPAQDNNNGTDTQSNATSQRDFLGGESMIRFFIERPIFAAVVSIVITLVGGISIITLPVAQYPEITPPSVSVSATYTGANAEVVADTVATPIEQQINGAEDMLYMSSISANDGSMSLSVTFEIGRDLDLATVDVQNRLSLATPQLPADVTKSGVTVLKKSPDILGVVSLSSPGGTYDSLFLTNYASINIADALARIEGVGNVQVFGAADYSMRIWLDPGKMADLGLTVDDIASAINEQNVQAPAGQIGLPPVPPGQEFQYAVQVKGRLSDVKEFLNIVLRANPDGSMVRIKDVGSAELGSQAYNNFSRLNGQDTSSILIYQLPGANALQTIKQVRATMETLSTQFPTGVEYSVPYDTTLFVNASIAEVMQTLFEALLLVLFVVFIFLQNWRATLIPMLTVPVSLVGTFAFFTVLDFSINTLSLFGIVLAIGLVVDDAIVVVEAVQRIMDEEGLSPKEATIKAMDEVSGAIIGTSLVLIAVFVPVAFMGGITGRLYQQFALTLAVSVAISTLNALTLSPSMCALLLRPKSEAKGPLGWFFDKFNAGFEWITRGYLAGVRGALRLALLTMAILAVLIVGCLGLIEKLPTGFVPDEDQGYFMATIQLPPAASLERNNAVMRHVEDVAMKLDGVEDVIALGGMNLLNGSSSSYSSSMFVVLKSWDERQTPALSVDGIMQAMRGAFRDYNDAVVSVFNPPPIRGMGTAGGFTFELQDRTGKPIEELASTAQSFMDEARKRPEIGAVFTSFNSGVPQIKVDVDREKAKTLGVPVENIFAALQTFLGGYYVNDFNKFGRTYRVMLQAEPDFRRRVDQIGSFYVRAQDGQMIPLSTLTKTDSISGPEYVQHFNLYQTVEINGGAAPGYSSGQALTALKEVAAEHLPQGYGYAWSGMSYQEVEQGGQAVQAFGLAVLMVVLFLCALYESWLIPWSVILCVPVAVFGAMVGQLLRGLDNNVYAQIGLVMLIGLAAKNAILIVEFAMMRHKQGLTVREAAMDAAHLRFRPILMTSFAFILGVLPLVLASGAGAASRHSLGTSVFAGMIFATMLGTFFIPTLYQVVERLRGNRANEKPDTAQEPPGATTEATDTKTTDSSDNTQNISRGFQQEPPRLFVRMEPEAQIPSWLQEVKQAIPTGELYQEIALAVSIILLAVVVYYVSKPIMERLIRALSGKTPTRWDNYFVERGAVRNVAALLPAIILLYGSALLPDGQSEIHKAIFIWMLAEIVALVTKFIDTSIQIYEESPISRRRSLKGYAQLGKMFVYILGSMVGFSILVETSPWALISGLGALSAVLLLIFRDTILSLVASISIATNDLLRKGDWIQMDSFGANGDVVDMALHAVKVQNFDKTITAVPTHKFLDNSFINWRGMQEAGGRRIKRSLLIDMTSVRFASPEELEAWQDIYVLTHYLMDKALEIEESNRRGNIPEESHPLNGRRQTNLGVFRAYVRSYLQNHPQVDSDGMLLLVRQLEPEGDHGLPLEIYCFTKTTAWAEYEAIQSDIFDHMLSALPYFGLRVYQRNALVDNRECPSAAQ